MNTLKKVKISAIITSGGSSSRFGSNKLLEKLQGDFSVIEVTILKFIDLVDEIVIPCKNDIKNHILNSKIYCDKIKFALPGATRQKSVYEGLLNCSNPEIVLIHDGARPYIDKETIKKTIDLTYQKSAVVVGKMAVDTIKEVKDGVICATLNRKNIFFAHTPQAFKYDLIKKIHDHYKNEDGFTDDSSMAEKFGQEVFILEELSDNLKITFPADLKIIP